MSERARELLRAAEQAFADGDLQASMRHATEAERLARAAGEADLADRALCSRALVRIELGDGRSEIPTLQRLLLASTDPRNRWSAAFYIAQAYYREDEFPNAISYGRRATELAEDLNERQPRAATANLLGIVALRSCDFDTAEESLQKALAAYSTATGNPATIRIMAAQVRDNLGYVLMCTDRLEAGISSCEQARRELDAVSADHYVYEVLQDLCYGYILDERLERAESCGERALALADRFDDPLVVKNCLFLLGEAAIRRGDTFTARRRLRELTRFYPELAVSDEIIDVFMATDLLQVVNLKG